MLKERGVPRSGVYDTLPPPTPRSLNTGSGEVPINETRDGPAASPDTSFGEVL